MTRGAIGVAALLVAAVSVTDPGALAAQPRRAAVLLAGVVVAVIVAARGARASVPAALAVLAVLAALVGIRSISGSSIAAERAATLVGAVVVAVAVRGAAPDQVGAITRTYAVGVVAIAGGASLVHAVVAAPGAWIHGGAGNANWLGITLGATLLPCADAALDPRARPPLRWAARVAVLLGFAAVLHSASRTAWVALGAGAAGWALSARGPRWVAAAPAGAALVALALAVASPDLSVAARDDGAAVTALAGRGYLWGTSLRASAAAGLLGAGTGAFGHAFLETQAARLAALEPTVAARVFENAETAHSDLLHLAVEQGPLGPALLVVALVLAARALARCWRAGAAAIVVVAVAGVGDDALGIPAVAVLVALLAAAGEGSALAVRSPAFVAAALSAGLLGRPVVASWLATRWAHEAQAATPDRRLPLLARATRLAPASGEAAFALGVECARLGDYECARRELERSQRLLPNVGTDVALGNALLAAGDLDAAVAAYRRAVDRHPGSFASRVALANGFVERGDDAEAARHADVARRLYPGHAKLSQLDERIARARARRESGG